MSGQTRTGSFVESVTNLAADIAIGLLSQAIIFPLLGYDVAVQDQLTIVVWFMIVNWLRMWVIRRWFNSSAVRQTFEAD